MNIEYETAKFLGEEFQRETFESLTKRKASDLEYSLNGFIKIN